MPSRWAKRCGSLHEHPLDSYRSCVQTVKDQVRQRAWIRWLAWAFAVHLCTIFTWTSSFKGSTDLPTLWSPSQDYLNISCRILGGNTWLMYFSPIPIICQIKRWNSDLKNLGKTKLAVQFSNFNKKISMVNHRVRSRNFFFLSQIWFVCYFCKKHENNTRPHWARQFCSIIHALVKRYYFAICIKNIP